MERLNSWKEIANYLGVTVRTAQKWEHERGLPVERLPGTRGPVSISVFDLEAWRQSAAAKGSNGQSQNGTGMRSPGLGLQRWILLGASLAGVLTLGLLSWSISRSERGKPVSYAVAGKTLSVFDSAGRLLWDHTFPDPIHENLYQERLLTWMGDLDGDDTTEFLFVYHKNIYGVAGSVLYCFSEDGSIRWQFVPGRAIATAYESFDPSFFASHALAVTRDSKRGLVIALSTPHSVYYPSQLALLSGNGDVLAEYWHSGHINMVKALDLDKDGRQELYLTGINNELRMATLIVLELEDLRGVSGSRHNEQYQLLDIPPAKERARIVFPRSCINRRLETFNKVSGTNIGQKTFTLSTQEDFNKDRANSGVMYEFTHDLKLESVSPTSAFTIFHDHLAERGMLDHRFDPKEVDRMARGVQFLPSSTTMAMKGSDRVGR